MSTTIKGPIRFDPKGDNSDLIKKMTEAGAKIKLPFKATGFKSTKMPKGIDLEGVSEKKKRVYKRRKNAGKK